MKNNITSWWSACIDRPKTMILRGVAAFVFAALSRAPAVAGSVSSSDTYAGDVSVIAVPEGTFLAVNYTGFRNGNQFIDPNGNRVSNSNIDIFTNIIRFDYAARLWNNPLVLEFALPYADPTHSSIGGASLSSVSTFFSPTLVLAYGIINAPQDERFLAFTNYGALPAGIYSNNKPINPATPDQFVWIGQLTYAEGVGKFAPELHNFWIDAIGNISVHSNGSSPIVGYNSMTQQNSYDLKGFIRYNWTPLTFLAAGVEKSWGGLQTATGSVFGPTVPNVALSRDDYLKGHLQFAVGLAPDLQFASDITHDFERQGGFKEDFTIEFRIAKLFYPTPAAK
jgi:hypothetical protein